MTKSLLLAGVAGLSLISSYASAQDASLSLGGNGNHHGHHGHNAGHDHANAPIAPVSIMGHHLHEQGGFMMSYRFMRMEMEGNRIGSDSVSPSTIATTVANPFASVAGQPPTLRVVPTEMTMDMHMFGAMYGLTDWLTLTGMAMYKDNKMDHITFQGGAGTNVLGTFETRSSGWGDLMVGGLMKAYSDDVHSVNLNVGLSLPTGSIKEEDSVLAPNGMTPRLRLPYAMQLGSGTYDFHPGVTYSGHQERWSWGAQYKAEIRLEDENSQGYALGDKHGVSAWAGRQWSDNVGTTLRVTASTQDDIDGIDPNIVAPVQTANPDNYGGQVIEAGLGLNLRGTQGWLSGHELGFELSMPVYQDLNGPQMERDYVLSAGWSKSF